MQVVEHPEQQARRGHRAQDEIEVQQPRSCGPGRAEHERPSRPAEQHARHDRARHPQQLGHAAAQVGSAVQPSKAEAPDRDHGDQRRRAERTHPRAQPRDGEGGERTHEQERRRDRDRIVQLVHHPAVHHAVVEQGKQGASLEHAQLVVPPPGRGVGQRGKRDHAAPQPEPRPAHRYERQSAKHRADTVERGQRRARRQPEPEQPMRDVASVRG